MVPCFRSTTVYWPRSSVVAERVFSIRTGLLASTVTPGITAPVVSFTTPAIALVCAKAVLDAAIHTPTTTAASLDILAMSPPNGPNGTKTLWKIRSHFRRVKELRVDAILTPVASGSLRCHDGLSERGVDRWRAG